LRLQLRIVVAFITRPTHGEKDHDTRPHPPTAKSLAGVCAPFSAVERSRSVSVGADQDGSEPTDARRAGARRHQLGLHHGTDHAGQPDDDGAHLETRFGDGYEFHVFNFSNVGTGISQDSGLLTMAFHPDFQTNGKFYVTLAASSPAISNQLREYKMVGGAPVLQRTMLSYSGTAIHTIDWIGFNPLATGAERDYLYVTTGDGGPQASSGSYTNKAQYLDNVYGKMLRVDVTDGSDAYPADANKNFGIPIGNPFVGQAGKLGEIVQAGFRNPWRASFDRANGDMYIGDVGFNSWEELDFIKAGTLGQDFGWPTKEGMVSPPPGAIAGIAGPPAGTTMINPILVRAHGAENSITGGFVYRGPITELQGKYIYADHIFHRVNTLNFNRDTLPQNFVGNNVTNFTNATTQFNNSIVGGGTLSYVTSFAEDAAGNLFIVKMADTSGSQYSSVGEGIIYYLLPLLPGDFDADGDVDGSDFVSWQTNFPKLSGATLAQGDADGDGDVDGADFVVWQTHFPSPATTLTVVPEPAGALLAIAALVAIGVFRARSRG
jgi:glucose/arabinose dehydrogenase